MWEFRWYSEFNGLYETSEMAVNGSPTKRERLVHTAEEGNAFKRLYHLTHNVYVANYRAGSPATALNDAFDFAHSTPAFDGKDKSKDLEVDSNCKLKRVVAEAGFQDDALFQGLKELNCSVR